MVCERGVRTETPWGKQARRADGDGVGNGARDGSATSATCRPHGNRPKTNPVFAYGFSGPPCFSSFSGPSGEQCWLQGSWECFRLGGARLGAVASCSDWSLGVTVPTQIVKTASNKKVSWCPLSICSFLRVSVVLRLNASSLPLVCSLRSGEDLFDPTVNPRVCHL